MKRDWAGQLVRRSLSSCRTFCKLQQKHRRAFYIRARCSATATLPCRAPRSLSLPLAPIFKQSSHLLLLPRSLDVEQTLNRVESAQRE